MMPGFRHTRDMETLTPTLEPEQRGPIEVLTDPSAARAGYLVAFTDRRGGVSGPPYDTLNLGARVGDEAADVAVNRRIVGEAVGFDADRLVLAKQVHGAAVMEVSPGDAGVMGEADVLVVRTRGPVGAILTADCVPVAVAGTEGIAIAHAGWRGLVAGAVERAIAAVGTPLAAWIGPSIRACCYEVGADVLDAFSERGLPVAGPDRVDPPAAARAILDRSGVQAIAMAEVCTSTDPRYFSYRRDGTTGRQAGIVGLLST